MHENTVNVAVCVNSIFSVIELILVILIFTNQENFLSFW